MTPLGTKREAPMADQLATAEPDEYGHIHLTLKRVKYVVDGGSSQRTRSSHVHQHGKFLREFISEGKLGKAYWFCGICDHRGGSARYVATATSSARMHLAKIHGVNADTPEPTSSSVGPEDSDTQSSTDQPRTAFFGLCTHQARESFRDLLLGFILDEDLSFDVLRNDYLQEALRRLNQSYEQKVGIGRSSMRTALDDVFNSKKDLIKNELQNALTKIHLSFDGWTSPNQHALLGVSAHFLNSRGIPQQRLIALRHLTDTHSGLNLAGALHEVIVDWNLGDIIGCLVSDNASNNDVCTRTLYRTLNPAYEVEDATHRRIRCYGHVLNLVGRAFLSGDNSEAFEQASRTVNSGDQGDFLADWRRHGPIAKLHNLVKWVRFSPQRTILFRNTVNEAQDADDEYQIAKETPRELQLISNNDTRWNSTYKMIERALVMREQISKFLVVNNLEPESSRKAPEDCQLDGEDWKLLIELKDLLEPLYKQTMLTQGWAQSGSHGALWEFILGVEFVLGRMEKWKQVYDSSVSETATSQSAPSRRRATRRSLAKSSDAQPLPEQTRHDGSPETGHSHCADRVKRLQASSRAYLLASIMNGWSKLDDYYSKLDESPLYAGAVILHPGFGLNFLTNRWSDHDGWALRAKKQLAEYWEKWYFRADESSPGAAAECQVASSYSFQDLQEDTEWSDFLSAAQIDSNNPDGAGSDESSELDRYYDLPPSRLKDGKKDPIQWWIRNREEFPTVSKLALDLLAIPPMSADCERAFSAAKLTVTSQRHAMKPDTLEKVQCLRNWMRRGSIDMGGFLGPVKKCTSTPS
ncbi:uncharacterized protein CPUR_06833 [Claviceps purpurea 20.1]|uniref:HAT C-terminal dimerisation domain-containing protein n=1 Tax=Claviceps purpurea (strain 20.1) TaxID=1111077 RepID=M1WHD5_CLAP2|nr:uncharacterized protein CPUR_06833 [Claviceps purpurea 20.1]